MNYDLFEVHQYETNEVSQSFLESGRKKFSKNCLILYCAFLRGDIINSDNSPVREFRRRRQDLTDVNEVHISVHSVSGNLKNWYMSVEDLKYNLAKFDLNK